MPIHSQQNVFMHMVKFNNIENKNMSQQYPKYNIYITKGSQSLVVADIKSGGLGSIIVEGLGYESLFYTNIFCESGDTCLLKCAAGACDSSTDYYCLDGATCNLNPKQCLTRSGGTFRGIGCPTISTSIACNNAKSNKMGIEDITKNDGLGMEFFGDFEVATNELEAAHKMDILFLVVIGLSLVILVVVIYYKMNGNDEYLELK